MPSKKDILEELSKTTKNQYSKGEVKCFVTAVSSEGERKPSKLKKGDVFKYHIGAKIRPVVICKVVGGLVLAIPLSTTEDNMNLCESKSRFFGDNFFGKQIVTVAYDHAMDNFCGVFDNNTSLNKAVRLMKQFYNETL
jgi:hypothetical protein|tara:strand:- start:788 stop:1201 length:414 start_codon:yes stop_codon:yes gene_type:complete